MCCHFTTHCCFLSVKLLDFLLCSSLLTSATFVSNNNNSKASGSIIYYGLALMRLGGAQRQCSGGGQAVYHKSNTCLAFKVSPYKWTSVRYDHSSCHLASILFFTKKKIARWKMTQLVTCKLLEISSLNFETFLLKNLTIYPVNISHPFLITIPLHKWDYKSKIPWPIGSKIYHQVVVQIEF